MRRFRHLLSRLLIESALIVVSVLVALTVNNWKSQRDATMRAEEARTAIMSEIETNRAMLVSDQYLPHHERLQETYSQAMTARAPDPKALFSSGLHPAIFGDAAWRSFATSTIFADFRVSEVLTLSKLYHLQAEIERRDDSVVSALTSPRSDRETPEFQRDLSISIGMFLNDLVPAEQRLLKQYDEALQQLRRQR